MNRRLPIGCLVLACPPVAAKQDDRQYQAAQPECMLHVILSSDGLVGCFDRLERSCECAAAFASQQPAGRGVPQLDLGPGAAITAAASLWFWKDGAAQSFFTLKLPTTARDLALHPDARRLAIAFHDGFVRVYDMSA